MTRTFFAPARSSRRVRLGLALFACAALALALAGCNDDDDAPPVAAGATLATAADSATVAWNAPATIDVLANDAASSGSVSLASVGTAAHGSVAVVGGQLVYTPTAGYFGDDTVTYTARADDGGATATGTLSLSVEARMQLSGVASDAPLANADVLVSVGSASVSTMADAAGQYSVNIATAQPTDFVTVIATGTGAQSNVKLISLVGDAAGLAAAADAAGNVASAQVPALNATHLSTAQAVLAARVTAGVFPATAVALDAAAVAVHANELLHLATLLRLVADQGVALPAGVGDTLQLLQDRARLEAFASGQLETNGSLYSSTRAGVIADALPSAPLGLAGSGPQTLVYINGPMVTYRPDGTATVNGSVIGFDRAEATWSETQGTVTLTYLTPLRSTVFSSDTDPISGIQNEIAVEQSGWVLRHVAGDRYAGFATVAGTGTATYVDGSRSGQAATGFRLNGVPESLNSVIDVERRLDIATGDFSPGSRWGGVLTSAIELGAVQQDVMRIVDASQGVLEESGATVQWTVADRWMTVTSAGLRIRYARLSADSLTGLERWVAVDESTGAAFGVRTVSMVRADPDVKFDVPTLARDWRWEDFYVDDPAHPLIFSVFSDGTASLDTGSAAAAQGQPYNWAIDAQGRLVFEAPHSAGEPYRVRRWTALLYRGGNYVALATTRVFDGNDAVISRGSALVLRFTDVGPAIKP